jgi:streptogramin lyase
MSPRVWRSGALGPDGAIYVAAIEGGVPIGRLDPQTGCVTAVTR